jgi:hypothetical protein
MGTPALPFTGGLMYVARKPFTGQGKVYQIGDEVDLSGFPRPESLVRTGIVVWKGEGRRDRIVAPKTETRGVKGAHPVLTNLDEMLDKPPAKKAAAKKTAAKKVAS